MPDPLHPVNVANGPVGPIFGTSPRGGAARNERRRIVIDGPLATGMHRSGIVESGTGATVALGQLPDGRAVYLKHGAFISDPAETAPTAHEDYARSVYLAARIAVADGQDLMGGLSLQQKKSVVERIEQELHFSHPRRAEQFFTNPQLALQQRAAAATVLRAVLSSLDTTDPEAMLLGGEVVDLLAQQIRDETHEELRDHGVERLDARASALPPGLRARVDAATTASVDHPAWDLYFANGNNILREVCYTGHEFFESEVRRWCDEGFEITSRSASSGSGRVVLEKKIEGPNGEPRIIQKTMVMGYAEGLAAMADPNVHVIVFSGHADWGRAIVAMLKTAPPAQGPKKTVMIHHCSGTAVLDPFRDVYPRSVADVQTTRYGSVENEDHFAYGVTSEYIVKERSWADIHDRIAKGVFDMIRRLNSRNNYVTPADSLTREKVVDSDDDGISDLLDELYDVGVVQLPAAANAFAPDSCSHDRITSGKKIHAAAQFANTAASFSQFLQHLGRELPFVSAGLYHADSGDPDYGRMVRIVTEDVDVTGLGHDAGRANLPGSTHRIYKVQLNDRFAGAPRDAVRAAVLMEVGRVLGSGATVAERELQGLMLAALSLTSDDKNGGEEGVFNGLREHHGLPATLTFDDAQRYLRFDPNLYGGADRGLSAWIEALGPRFESL